MCISIVNVSIVSISVYVKLALILTKMSESND